MIRRFSLFKSLCRKFPGWAVSGLILVAGSACFLAWWVSFKFRNATSFPRFASGSEVSTPVDVNEVKPDEVVLCGNTLVSFKGKIIARQWIEGIGDAPPALRGFLPDEKLVLLGTRGMVGVFGFDGKARPPITVDGKPLGSAAFSRGGDTRVIFVSEGNLWMGRIDWLNSVVTDGKRITDVVYFRNDVFRGEFFWNDRTLLIPVLGRTHRVNLETGAISPDQANIAAITRGASPDGKKTVIPFAYGKFLLMDFASGVAKQFSVNGSFREFLWLDENRLAYGSSRNEISILNVPAGKVEAFASPGIVLKLVAASPEGESLVLGTDKGPMIFSTASGRFAPVSLPVDDGVWISETSLLCTNSSTDTAFRGVWRVNSDGSKELISNQPADSLRAATGARPMVAIPGGGALWVSGGNLWLYDRENKAVSQVTQDQHLNPTLQILR